MSIYLQLFLTFFKIGLFGFGGGYGMLSLIQNEVVERNGWISASEFTDIVAISQMTPGPIGINSATYIGYTATNSVLGSCIATFAVMLPSFIIILTICHFFSKFKKKTDVQHIMQGLRPAVIGLIAAAALLLINEENFVDYLSWIFFAGAFLLNKYCKVHPILIIVFAGIAGFIVYGIF
ncbi:MAG: chromate transporter [Paludibacteraceae bacterium]